MPTTDSDKPAVCGGIAAPCSPYRGSCQERGAGLRGYGGCVLSATRGTEARRFEEEWRLLRFQELGATYGGLSGKTSADFANGDAHYVSFLDVLDSPILTPRKFGRVRVSDAECQNRVAVGDVLYNATSETPEDLAMGSMVSVDARDLYLNSFCFGFRILNRYRCDPLFLAYWSRGIPGRNSMRALAQGATRYNLSKRRFLGLEVPVPSLSEQRAIATVLSEVDELIGSLEALIAKKRAIKQSTMQQLLTGRTRLPRFGREWETSRLGELGTFSKGRGIRRDELGETGVRCVRYGELYTRYENYVAKPVSRILQHVADAALPIRHGDLLFAGSGETAEEIGICVAYIGEEPAYVGGDIIVLRASGQDAVYLAHVLNSPVAARQKARMAQGDAIVHIRADHLAEVEFPLPPLPEQRAIAAVHSLSDMDTEIAAQGDAERRIPPPSPRQDPRHQTRPAPSNRV